MPTFITPYSGTAELTASNGLTITDQGRWQFSQQGYNDGATFGLSLGYPNAMGPNDFYYGPHQPRLVPTQTGGILNVTAQNWTIAVIGNDLTDYTDPDTHIIYPASQCRIEIRGQWQITRQQNSNSFNGQGVIYGGTTQTDLGNRDYWGTWITGFATYRIQGANVTGGEQDTFSNHVFYATMTETATTDNSNKEFQSNTITRPVWVYTYSKSWQTGP